MHALMFPLEWICCYIPLLPTTKQFLDILQSPVPFMIGIPHSQSLSQKVSATALQPQYLSTHAHHAHQTRV